jgi:hypothetical protein
MTKIPKISPSTLAEFKTNIQTLRTKLEQIEYLSLIILNLQDEDERHCIYGEEYEKNRANCDEHIQEMTVFAKDKIKNLGVRPVKWIGYPIVSSVGQYNELKGSFKNDSKLMEWVKWLLSNIEHSVGDYNSTLLEWKFNDRVIRQFELDSHDKGTTNLHNQDEEYIKFIRQWGNAQQLDDDFVDHLERQLKILSIVVPPNKSKIYSFENSIKKSIGQTSPITLFIDEQIKDGKQIWQEAWSKLFKQAQKKLTDNEELTIWHIGEFSVFLRKALKQTSKGIDHAVEYQEGDSPEWKQVLRQSFGSMFRRALKKSQTLSDSPK